MTSMAAQLKAISAEGREELPPLAPGEKPGRHERALAGVTS